MKPAGLFGSLFIICLMLFAHQIWAQTPLRFGWSTVTPHTADYDGDRRGEQGLYDSLKGTVSARKINGDELAFDLTIGLPGFIAACADFDGDDKADPSSYDLANGVVYAFLSASGYQLNALPCAVGASTTRAKPADYDGDHKADPALYDSASGAWIIYPSVSGYQPVSFILGGNGAAAVPMDYDADGKADPCVYDQNTGLWITLCSASQYALTWVVYGGPGCVPAPADFDGDNKADPAVYSAALGVWGTLNSASNYAPNIIIQGGPDCTPIPGNYYFTNQADYALYNTTNGCWNIAYNNLGGIYTMLGSEFLKGLVAGAGRETGEDIAGWSMNKIFHHNNNPTDPNWGEESQILNAMNEKLDTLLQGQVAIQGQISNLAAQLQYDMSQVTLLIEGGAANAACSTILTHYDQNNLDSYRAFYQCDTNNLPPNSSVLTFANNVKGQWDIEDKVTTIYSTIMPSATSRGVLWDWAALATNNLTPDNLTDNFAALVNYYGNLYMYQMKAVSMYVDACRVVDTSAWARAQTALYITNDVVNMIRQEVDLFRTITYTYVMCAVNAAYNPASTNNQLIVTNVAEVLADLEFFSREWLGQTESLCTTFLTYDRPDSLGWYTGIIASANSSNYEAQAVITNRGLSGHAYGYWDNTNQTSITVTDSYAFIRYDFGQQPCGTYTIAKGRQTIGSAAVVNYDQNMQPTSDPTITNWFGHLYAAPVSLASLTLPLDSPAWWNYRQDSVTYLGAQPGNNLKIYYNYINPSNITNLTMQIQEEYCLQKQRSLPKAFGVWPWVYVFGYPFSINNAVARPFSVRAYVTIENTSTKVERYEDGGFAFPNQQWSWNCCGVAQFQSSPNMAQWTAQSGTATHPTCSHEVHSVSTNYYNGMTYATVQGIATSVVLYVGGQIYLQQDCERGEMSEEDSFAIGNVSFKAKQIIVSFY